MSLAASAVSAASLAASVAGLTVSESRTSQAPWPCRCMTFNLCNTPQMDKDKAYDGLRFHQRLDKIAFVIKTLSPDIIGLQEVRDYEGGTVMADLWKKLGPLGYRIHFQEGSPHEFAVYNAIAYKAAKVWPQAVHTWWNSDTPDTVSCSYGNGWPRAVLAIKFYPVKEITVERKKQGTDSTVSFKRPDPDFTFPGVLVVNSHLGLAIGTSDPRERVRSNQTTIAKITQIVSSKPIFVVSLGDFNSFTDVKTYEEEMAVYSKNQFTDGVTSSQLCNQDGTPVSGTWMGFPPDALKCSDTQFGASIDHMWYRVYNMDKQIVTIQRCFVSTLTGEKDLDSRKTTKESELLKSADGTSLRDKRPSDHLPVLLDFTVNRKDSEAARA